MYKLKFLNWTDADTVNKSELIRTDAEIVKELVEMKFLDIKRISDSGVQHRNYLQKTRQSWLTMMLRPMLQRMFDYWMMIIKEEREKRMS